jgi:hypothetical protein
MEELIQRLEASRTALAGLRAAVERREPWPLSEHFGTEPEADWGPREVLAHVAEMVPYWLAQFESIIAGPSEPVPFGRVATDPERIDRIGRDRALRAGELFDRIDGALAVVADRVRQFDLTERARRGLHPRLGEITIEASVERFLVGHLEEHVRQLEEIVAAPGTIVEAGPTA